MKVYVAGSSAELDRCEAFIARVREAGHVVTFDWTVGRRAQRGGDASLADDEREAVAIDCLVGVRNAKAFVLLYPQAPTRGAWVEYGVAIATSGCGVIVVGDDRSTVMTALGGCMRVGAEAAALDMLATWGAQ
jgi:hypothetical protein